MALLAIGLGLALSLALGLASGCDRDRRSIPDGRMTSDVAAMLAHLPADAWGVVGVRAARARRVPALAPLLARMPALPLDPSIGRACGLDPFAAVDLAVAALGGGGGEQAVVVALAGTFTRDSIARCIADRSAQTGERLSAADDGPLTVYGPGGAARGGGGAGAAGRAYAYWPAADLVILSPAADGARAALMVLAGAGGAAPIPAPTGCLGRVHTDAALWAAGLVSPAMHRRMAAVGADVPGVRGFFATVDADPSGDGSVSVLVGLRFATDREAAGAADSFRAQRGDLARAMPDPRAGAIVKRLEVARSGPDLAVQASLGPTEVELVVALIAAAAIDPPATAATPAATPATLPSAARP